jgi:hypothetical protein
MKPKGAHLELTPLQSDCTLMPYPTALPSTVMNQIFCNRLPQDLFQIAFATWWLSQMDFQITAQPRHA